MAQTPMMKQYEEAKRACPDALLLFRMGDFYEMFHDDARTAARVLNLALTSREKGAGATAMAGFPHHQLESYLGKLIAAGMKAAVCDQVEDPKTAKGLVRREVTRIVTPGTVTDDALLDPRENNYLAAVSPGEPAGLAWVELSTGRFMAAGFPAGRLPDQLARIGPAECLLAESAPPPGTELDERTMVTRRPDWAFSPQTAADALSKHFGVSGMEGFGFSDDEADRRAICAAAAVLDYLAETQKSSLEHIDRLTPYRASGTLEIDQSSRRSLEIGRTIRDGRREGSLLWVLDRTRTPMGARLLAEWVANPPTDAASIRARHDAVEELLGNPSLSAELGELLRRMYDIERLLTRAATGRASPRDLSFLGRTLKSLPGFKAKIAGRKSALLCELEAAVDLCPELRAALESALADDCPLTSREGGFIRERFSAELDALRELAHGGKRWIAGYQAEETRRTGISSLKVGFNQVFGYYIEVTNSHRDKIPPEYIRKQTLKNAERYITPELKEYEEKVLTADGQAKELECKLFQDLRGIVAADRRRLQATAAAIAAIDVLVGLADLARARNYCRPEIVEQPVLRIMDGRHPVLDVIEPDGKFVPNDTVVGDCEVSLPSPASGREAGGEGGQPQPPDALALTLSQTERGPSGGTILLVTGPNMAGKSTYIRQTALLTLMAQIGSYVPAREATVGVADRIFARVGASDELTRGQSTFMVEMIETARILNSATRRSLVILDEIGRGTSTYDGISLAWSVVEHLHERIGCRTLFATHYHELTDLEQSLPGVKNLNVAVREWGERVIFLHKIVPGAADKSYGIHVARLAGVPREVVRRAKEVLAQLEEGHLDASGRSKIALHPDRPKGAGGQLTLFGPVEHPLLDELRRTDLDRLTPIEALQRIQQWQESLKDETRRSAK
ncbi:MAG: DNA mismatch repair protein MutS [Pirellulales bacterium]|nr:DNA mismatch repair protein MutS [Pirellulales bacterium]